MQKELYDPDGVSALDEELAQFEPLVHVQLRGFYFVSHLSVELLLSLSTGFRGYPQPFVESLPEGFVGLVIYWVYLGVL